MDCEKLILLLSDEQSAQAPLVRILRQYLSNGQVFWSGIPREKAQEWADRHRLQI